MTDLPPGWAWSTLGQVANWGSGGTPRAKNSEYYGGDIPWAVIGDLNDGLVNDTATRITERALTESAAKMVPAGALLIAMYGSIGKLGIAGIPLSTNQAVAFALPDSRVLETQYLFHYLSSQRSSLLAAGKGAAQQNISQTLLRSWLIPIPPLVEQRRIVVALEDHLSRLDAAVELLRSAKKRTEKLIDSALGRILDENSWVTVALEDLVSSASRPSYGVLVPGDHVADGIPLVRVKDLVEGTVRPTDLKRIEPAIADQFKRTFLKGGELLISLVGTIGRVAIAPEGLAGANVARAIGVFDIDRDRVNPRWVLNVLRSSEFSARLSRLSNEVARKTLNLSELRKVQIPLPNRDLQEEFNEYIDRIDSAVAKTRDELMLLHVRAERLRQALLMSAFAGRLVEQDPSDEPASVLLERIAAERAAAPKSKRARKTKTTRESAQ